MFDLLPSFKRRPFRWAALCTAVLLATPATTVAGDDGGWASQSFNALNTGWNAVWLEVDPVDPDPAVVFSGIAAELDAVWTFVPGRSADDAGRWLVFDPNSPAFVSTLQEIQPARMYLLSLNATPATELVVVGRPSRRPARLNGERGGFLGGSTDDVFAPSLADFFGFGGVSEQLTAAYKFDPMLGAAGSWFALSPALFEPVENGQAYWAGTAQATNYDGPLRVSAGNEGIQFSSRRYLYPLLIEVPLVTDIGGLDVTVRARPSVAPPAGAPAIADPGMGGRTTGWLQYLDPDTGVWTELDDVGVTLAIPEGATTLELPLRANRAAVGVATAADGAMYQALVEVVDAHGNLVTMAAGMENASDSGTWVGEVALDGVSLHPDLGGDGTALAAPKFAMALILELPEEGSGDGARLMDQVCLEVAQDGGTFSAIYTSVMLSDDVTMTETSPGVWQGQVAVAADDPHNPYRHRYNPEHRDGYAVTRSITVTLQPDDPASGSGNPNEEAFRALRNASLGNNQLIGTYEETISGLLRGTDTITVRGTFRLFRLANERNLDGGC